MIEYKAVPSGLELSRRIVDCLEDAAPREYQLGEAVCAIRAVNGILQGRSTRSADELLAELEKCVDYTVPLLQSVRNFLRQKDLLMTPYTKHASRKPFTFQYCSFSGGRRLKIISQPLYDRAVKAGFPMNFFRESYFDHVTFYCLPDGVDLSGSVLRNCKFAVCRIKGISFGYSHIYDTEFYSSILNCADFYSATLANTRFQDCELSHVTMQSTSFKHCSTTDCTMDNVDYAGATLDGCFFEQITAGTIRLDWATITQGGATEEECRQNREAIYRVLRVKEAAA